MLIHPRPFGQANSSRSQFRRAGPLRGKPFGPPEQPLVYKDACQRDQNRNGWKRRPMKKQTRCKRFGLYMILSYSLIALAVSAPARAQSVPQYKVVPWPKELPNKWMIANATGLGVDKNDH